MQLQQLSIPRQLYFFYRLLRIEIYQYMYLIDNNNNLEQTDFVITYRIVGNIDDY